MTRLVRALYALPLLAIACGTNSSTPAPAANDFSLAIAPALQTVALAQDAGTSFTETYTVTTAVTAGLAQSIALSVSGLPADVTSAFDPAAIIGAGTSTLTLTIPSSAAAGSTAFTVTGASTSATHSEVATLAICIPGPVTLAVTQTDLYTCTNQKYQATFTVTNNSCAPVSVTEIELTGTIEADAGTTANCTSSGTSTYPLSATVPIGATQVVLPLTAAAYCCTSTPCPDFTCVESYSFQAVTTAGTLTAPAQDATIHLDENAPDGGCSVSVCP